MFAKNDDNSGLNWEVDSQGRVYKVAEMLNYALAQSGLQYVLTMTDCFSKKSWAWALIDKSAE